MHISKLRLQAQKCLKIVQLKSQLGKHFRIDKLLVIIELAIKMNSKSFIDELSSRKFFWIEEKKFQDCDLQRVT